MVKGFVYYFYVYGFCNVGIYVIGVNFGDIVGYYICCYGNNR